MRHYLRNRSRFHSLLVFASASVLSLIAVGAALAVGGGAQNGEDTSCCGWTGSDNPDNASGSYSYGNVTHNLILSEWVEPTHDYVRNKNMIWAQSTEDYLDSQASTRALDYEIRIHDQTYYNFVNTWQTNLPWSKAPEAESWIEELDQGYTEVDMEQDNPGLINANFNYFWDQRFDSEKTAIANAPWFWSELEWCNKIYHPCYFDYTGSMRKKVAQQ
jgi:hypothetical protein